jgi:SAM-dependent methyltransferase
MVDVALGAQTGDDRIRIIAGAAEEVPFAESSSDLVVTTASFDHCGDQVASLRECARFLAPGELARTHRPLQILALADVALGWERPGAAPSEGHAPRDRGRVSVTCVAPDPCHHPPDCDRDPLKGIWRSLGSPEALAGARRRGAGYLFEGPVGAPPGHSPNTGFGMLSEFGGEWRRWLAHQSGGLGVAGSSPVSPTTIDR